jgi:predicted nucleotidyltransferase
LDRSSFKSIVDALNEAEVDFIVVGGMAVLAHGYVRFTKDLDLVIRFSENHLNNAFRALEEIGYKPLVPVTASQFSDSHTRKTWIETKGMTVLNMYNDKFKGSPIDLFVEEPFEFEDEFNKAVVHQFENGVSFKVVDIDTLISMKEKVGRANDIEDVRQLRMIKDVK